MTLMPRSAVRKSGLRRSSFVSPNGSAAVVPDALSWRANLGGASAPRGPQAWQAACAVESGRTVIQAGPYGVIDLAAEAPGESPDARVGHVGVVWWDKRSFRKEDDDFGTIQTSFIPASVAEHVALRAPVATDPPPVLDRASAPQPVAVTRAPNEPPDDLPAPVPATRRATIAQEEAVARGHHVRTSRHLVDLTGPRGTRRAKLRRRRIRRRIILGAVVVIAAFVATVLIQTFIVTPFTVPSVSMKDTLQVGDRIVVNRLSYAFSQVHRGDVVVFTDPGGWLNADDPTGTTGGYIVKRVIAVPGDRVSCCSTAGRVVVNGREIAEPYAQIPVGSPAAAAPFDVTVPAGGVWVLGDNRYDSRDSSQTQGEPTKGFVPIANVVGQAILKVWPLDRVGVIGSAQQTFGYVPN
ncbi:signal peptidase I [Leifsonia sp. NPDC077715]|uniref:signal peptidase I n=1 Tax=Leifsonia sp. NPDC077715 TaxID=3155539 RepID=UPI00342A30C8